MTGKSNCYFYKLLYIEAIIAGKDKYLLVDSRPAIRFPAGHLPTAISLFAKEMPKNLDKLPKDKDQLLVFYCGGPTCPFISMAVKEAMKHGYTNVKGFQAGLPCWKKAKKPVHSKASWLAKNLNDSTIVIDARSKSKAENGHIKGAVSVTLKDLKEIKAAHTAKTAPVLLDVGYRGADIVVYSDSADSPEAISAHKQIAKWTYKKATILEGGFADWKKAGYPTYKGELKKEVRFVKKLVAGAIKPMDFLNKEMTRSTEVVFLDVRAKNEF